MTDKGTAPESRGCFCLGAGPQMSEMVRHCISESAIDHFRNSRVEFLKGLRSLIDSRIEHLSRAHQKGTTVPVE
jgi:hypothetical protein